VDTSSGELSGRLKISPPVRCHIGHPRHTYTIDTSPCRPRPNLHVVLTAASCVPESQSRLPLLTCSALVPTVPTQHAVMSRRRRFAKSIPTAAPGQPVAAQHSRTCSRPFPLADPARACPCPWQVTCNFTLGERGDRSRKPPASALRAVSPGPNTIDVEGPGPTPLNSPKVLKSCFCRDFGCANWPCSRPCCVPGHLKATT
jgi:hypothetical protein